MAVGAGVAAGDGVDEGVAVGGVVAVGGGVEDGVAVGSEVACIAARAGSISRGKRLSGSSTVIAK